MNLSPLFAQRFSRRAFNKAGVAAAFSPYPALVPVPAASAGEPAPAISGEALVLKLAEHTKDFLAKTSEADRHTGQADRIIGFFNYKYLNRRFGAATLDKVRRLGEGFVASTLESLPSLLAALELEKQLFRPEILEALWQKATPDPRPYGFEERRIIDADGIEITLENRNGVINLGIPNASLYSPGHLETYIAEIAGELVDSQEGRAGLYRIVRDLDDESLRRPVIDFLTLPDHAPVPDHVAAAFKRFFEEEEPTRYTMGSMRGIIGGMHESAIFSHELPRLYAALGGEPRIRSKRQEKEEKKPEAPVRHKDSAACRLYWQQTTGLAWHAVKSGGYAVGYEAVMPLAHTRYISGMERPHYAPALDIAAVVNDLALSRGELAGNLAYIAEDAGNIRLRVPAALFHDRTYADHAKAALLAEGRPQRIAQWKEVAYRQAVARHYEQRGVFTR